MGIYLPNMEMPKEGNWITLRVYPDGQCFLYSWRGNDIEFIEQLTAVPVQEPHGRLIDADALIKSDRMVGKLMMYGGEYVYTQAEIDRSTTVIPASEEAET